MSAAGGVWCLRGGTLYLAAAAASLSAAPMHLGRPCFAALYASQRRCSILCPPHPASDRAFCQQICGSDGAQPGALGPRDLPHPPQGEPADRERPTGGPFRLQGEQLEGGGRWRHRHSSHLHYCVAATPYKLGLPLLSLIPPAALPPPAACAAAVAAAPRNCRLPST